MNLAQEVNKEEETMDAAKMPSRHFCEMMEDNLEWGDMFEFIWQTREYQIASTRNLGVSCRISYCPFCGKEIGTLSLLKKYEEAADQPEADKIDWESEAEVKVFKLKFLALQIEKEQRLKASSSQQTKQGADQTDTI